MAAATQESVYNEVIGVTQEYLGPAAERFISRQVETHLSKKPQELTREDLTKLIDWVKIAIALLTEDSKTVDAFTARLKEISAK